MDITDYRESEVTTLNVEEPSKTSYVINFGFQKAYIRFDPPLDQGVERLAVEIWSGAIANIGKLEMQMQNMTASLYYLFNALVERAGLKPDTMIVLGDRHENGE
jgi:hypothetical protein